MKRVTACLRDALLPAAGRIRRREWGTVEDTVLVFQPDHLGDILLSQPALRMLRIRHPTSRLIAVVGPWSQEIASMAWPVDEIVTVSYPGFTREASGSPIAPYRQLIVEAGRLRSFRARSVYVLRPDAWWAAWLASLVAPEVIAADDPRARRFATRAVSIFDDEHASLRASRIAAAGELAMLPTPSSSPLRLVETHQAAAEAEQILQERGVTDGYVVIHPGSGAAVKAWPAHRWRTVAAMLSPTVQHVVLTGSPSEAPLCDAIAETDPRCVSLVGATSVPVLAEVLRRATLALGPDSGPLHLAVAVGTPTVHLFGPSDPRRYGPWGNRERHRVVSAGWNCPRCGDLSSTRGSACGCMLAIQADDVINAARSIPLAHAY